MIARCSRIVKIHKKLQRRNKNSKKQKIKCIDVF